MLSLLITLHLAPSLSEAPPVVTGPHKSLVVASVEEFSRFLEPDTSYLLTLKGAKTGATLDLAWGGRYLRRETYSHAGTCKWAQGDGVGGQLQVEMSPLYLDAIRDRKQKKPLSAVLKAAFEVALRWFPDKTGWFFDYTPPRTWSLFERDKDINGTPPPEPVAYRVDILMSPSEAGGDLSVYVNEDGKVVGIEAGM